MEIYRLIRDFATSLFHFPAVRIIDVRNLGKCMRTEDIRAGISPESRTLHVQLLTLWQHQHTIVKD